MTTSAEPYGPQGGPVQLFFLKNGLPRRPMVDRGEGIYLWDTAGRRYIDASSGPIAANIGHANARVIAASDRQIRSVAYASRVFFENQANIDLADSVARLAGPGLERAFFVSGGSEANESAMKLARQYAITQGQATRWKVLSRNPSYHGSTLGTIAISGDPVSEANFGPMTRLMPKVPAPFTYRLPEGHTPQSYADQCADALESTIEREGPETVLAFILEPVGGLATGALVAPDNYYARVREICSRHGVLLIFDEVMSGAGRTGEFLAAQHWPDARPDIVTLAKGLGAGYTPLGAVLASRAMVDALAEAGGFMHGFTYGSNPLSCAIGHAVVAETVERGLIPNAAAMGARLRERLLDLQKDSRVMGDIRGKGLLMAIEIVADRQTKAILPAQSMAIQRIVALGMERGLLLYSRRTANGLFGEWLMVAPPLIVDAQQIDTIAALIGETLQAFEAQL
ncbi:MAG: aspartate aminotransferase family protein [Rhodoferax sp.]|nr:aspartate aminotransferase family protein [Rhodoferax sp.]MBP9928573.1 aspartate aminotransferase family protein [Rhodoferax sp.]HQX59666.1 aspartate aminotransferase family protein [Burkholderiaceae bacterium]HQZ04799.1 aspartate aminotransferase family protein [Burkholderiaceae bacterium]HRA63667.1 aspartate aminotransferase family protein [Burkholderiaceae bacterium]